MLLPLTYIVVAVLEILVKFLATAWKQKSCWAFQLLLLMTM